MITTHRPYRSELEAYVAATDALDDAHHQPAALTYGAALDRETALQVARLTHWRAAEERLHTRPEVEQQVRRTVTQLLHWKGYQP